MWHSCMTVIAIWICPKWLKNIQQQLGITSKSRNNFSFYLTVRPLHLALTATAGLLMALIFYIVVRHKTRDTHPVGLLWKLTSMMDIALCVSALAALFYQYVANEEEYIRCVHVPLTTILSRSFTAAWIMFAVAVTGTAVVSYAVNHSIKEKTVGKATMANLYCMMMVTCIAIIFCHQP